MRVTNDMHYLLVASPEYLALHGRPRTPADLQAHNCIRYRLPGGGFIPWVFVVDGKTVEFDISGSVVVINDPELVISAALEGIGIAYLYEEYVASLVADGRLVSLLDKSALPITDGFFLFYPSRRQNPAALRALIEFLRLHARKGARPAEAADSECGCAEADSYSAACRAGGRTFARPSASVAEIVVRTIKRASFAGQGRPRCIVARLSHITTSPFCHACS